MYLRFLKSSCDIYDKDFFDKNYAPVIGLIDEKVDRQLFLKDLKICDKEIGGQQSLGEKKAYVLLQTLRFINGENVFLFCSDDFGARCAMADQVGIPCVSIVAVFLKLKNMGISRDVVEPYFSSYIEMCANHKQMQLRVWELHGSYRRVRIDLLEVFDGIYGDKFSLMLNGDLIREPRIMSEYGLRSHQSTLLKNPVDFSSKMSIIVNNSTRHASQRCGPRRVIFCSK